jgi:hypothetical protein
MLKFKPEVRIGDFNCHLWRVLAECCLWSFRTHIDVEINSIEDGLKIHELDSLHRLSLAVDLDTDGDRAADLAELLEFLQRRLDPQYDIVYEATHVHVEWDAHRTRVTPHPTG